MTLFVSCAQTRPSVWCFIVYSFFVCVYFLYNSIINNNNVCYKDQRPDLQQVVILLKHCVARILVEGAQ